MLRGWLWLGLTTIAPLTAFAQPDADTTGKSWALSYSGYYQVAASARAGFSVQNSKLFIDGKSDRRLCHLEFRPTNGHPLLKAYLGDSLCPQLTIILGQLSNPIKYVEPQPEENQFTSYALYQHYVVNSDDIGLAVYGKSRPISYYVCLVNGTGRNTPDNNREKDVAGYCAYAPIPFVRFEIAGQIGQQPDGQRRIGFAKATFNPLSDANIQLASMADQRTWGWYASGSYARSRLCVNLRLHQTTRRSGYQWTASVQTGNDTLKCTLETRLGKRQHPDYVVQLQACFH